MLCPAVYPPDPTSGLTDPQMLPSPNRVRRSRNSAHRPCPECGQSGPRDRVRTRTLPDLGDPMGGRPREIHLTSSQHHCPRCRHDFPADRSDLAAPRALYTHRVVAWAVRLVVEDGLPSQTAGWHLGRDHRVFVPFATIPNGVEARGKKAVDPIRAAYLDWARDGFSGSIAAAELDDGPFGVLSIVENRAFKRRCVEVLDHPPAHGEIRAFFRRFPAALTSRGLSLPGITTDGSELDPQPLSEVFGAIEHQVGRFHILAELTQAVLHAVASVRKHLAVQKPKLPRGRPGTPEAKRTARRRRHLQRKLGDLFEHRHRFVRRPLTPGQPQTLRRISRGLPQLRALRQVVEEIYRLVDRRGRTETALTKLARLRSRVRRFKKLRPIFQKLQSPHWEKALTDRDDRLLGSTSKAVERSNRRHRTMQKTVYRVRTQPTISGRIALDRFRDAQRTSHAQTMHTLHHARRR
jgi:hypothetical protein